MKLRLMAGMELGYANGRNLLNRLLRREGKDSIKARTYQDFCCRSGQELGAYMAKKAAKVLEQAGFDGKTCRFRERTILPPELGKIGTNLSEKVNIQEAIQTINASRESAEERISVGVVSMENPDDTCYVSVEGIGVKHQVEHRKGTAEKARGIRLEYGCNDTSAAVFVYPDGWQYAADISLCVSLPAFP